MKEVRKEHLNYSRCPINNMATQKAKKNKQTNTGMRLDKSVRAFYETNLCLRLLPSKYLLVPSEG